MRDDDIIVLKEPELTAAERLYLPQILDGLKVGENVVTEGSFILKSEMLKGQLGEE